MKAYLFAIGCAIIWGIVPIIEKMGLAKIPVWTGLMFRCIGVFIGMTVLFLWKFSEIKSSLEKIPEGWGYLILGGFLASIVGQIFFYNALRLGDASKITPIAASYPLVTFILAVLFLKEGITLSKLGGIFFVILGVFWLK